MSTLVLINASCADQTVDAVVNAANNGLWAGGGICGVIFKKAGLSVSESTEAPTEQIEGIVIPGPLMLLQSGGTYTRSYENHIWSQNWSEKNGWVCVDGTIMSMLYPSVQIWIPRIDYSNNFEFHFKENITSVYFTVYDTNFEKVKQGETKDALKDLSDGTYYLVVEVTKQDEYVESEKQYETSGYECVYKMKVGD